MTQLGHKYVAHVAHRATADPLPSFLPLHIEQLESKLFSNIPKSLIPALALAVMGAPPLTLPLVPRPNALSSDGDDPRPEDDEDECGWWWWVCRWVRPLPMAPRFGFRTTGATDSMESPLPERS